jgi:hypothetical protein
METKIITASEGMILTNGSAYGRRIALGSLDSAENWHEITIEEYEQRMREEAEKEDEQRI